MFKYIIAALMLSFTLITAPAMASAGKVVKLDTQPVSAEDQKIWRDFSRPVAEALEARKAWQDPDYAAWAEAMNTANSAIVNKNTLVFIEQRAIAVSVARRMCPRIGCTVIDNPTNARGL